MRQFKNSSGIPKNYLKTPIKPLIQASREKRACVNSVIYIIGKKLKHGTRHKRDMHISIFVKQLLLEGCKVINFYHSTSCKANRLIFN